jgi:hypothetical protein
MNTKPSRATTPTDWQPVDLVIQDDDYQVNQTTSRSWHGEFLSVLDESGEAVQVFFRGEGTVAPGQLSHNDPQARAAAVVAYQINIAPRPSEA